jgi:hypothetical protein
MVERVGGLARARSGPAVVAAARCARSAHGGPPSACCRPPILPLATPRASILARRHGSRPRSVGAHLGRAGPVPPGRVARLWARKKVPEDVREALGPVWATEGAGAP